MFFSAAVPLSSGTISAPEVMFLVVLIHRAGNGENSDIIGVTPVGTAFAISETHVFTASHNVCVGSRVNQEIGLLKECNCFVVMEDLIVVNFLEKCIDEDEDWAIFRRPVGTFAHHARVCPENELPIKNGSKGDLPLIWSRDFPLGLDSSMSSTKVSLQSAHTNVVQYEEFASISTRNKKRKYVPVIKCRPVTQLERILLVQGGKVNGRCGAVYFARNGKVVAFHVNSIDDGTNDVTKSNSITSFRSHYPFSRGLVLCRLSKFMKWYNNTVAPFL